MESGNIVACAQGGVLRAQESIHDTKQACNYEESKCQTCSVKKGGSATAEFQMSVPDL